MPFSNAARNNMLGTIGITHASLHSGFPGDSGLNEISGGSPAYARRPVTFNAASGGSRTQSGSAIFDVPAATTIRYVGFWSALTGGSFLGYHPLGNSPAREFVVETASNLVRSPAHGLVNTDQIVFVGDSVPAGLAEGTIYFVVNGTADTIQVSATSGGAAIVLTSQAGSAAQVIKIVAEGFGSQATLTLSNSNVGLGL